MTDPSGSGMEGDITINRRNQTRAQLFRTRQDLQRTIDIINIHGESRTIRRRGRLNNIKHNMVLAALERRALKFRSGTEAADDRQASTGGWVDETGMVLANGRLAEDEQRQ